MGDSCNLDGDLTEKFVSPHNMIKWSLLLTIDGLASYHMALGLVQNLDRYSNGHAEITSITMSLDNNSDQET